MKRCRFCAEEIQDAAVLCRFCGNSQYVPNVVPQRKDTSGAWIVGAILISGILGIFTVAIMQDGVVETLKEEAVQTFVPPPSVVEIADTGYEPLFLDAGYYRTYEFSISDPRPCLLTGRIVGVSGGNHDVDVSVVDADGLVNLRNGRRFDAFFHRARTAAATLDVPLPGPGVYYLVVSNTFSVVTAKQVAVEAVRVTCQ